MFCQFDDTAFLMDIGFFLTLSPMWLCKAISGHLLASVSLAEFTSLGPEQYASIWIEIGLWWGV